MQQREIRALFTAETILVYQAYSPEIADRALGAGTFVAPFKRDRMTWIKPSFRWMGYRSGWATKTNQDKVLAIEITRDGFHWALEHSCLSHYDRDVHPSRDVWMERVHETPVRIQWDPERDLCHQPLDHRTIQIGLGGNAVGLYVNDWIVSITDVTQTMRAIADHVNAGRLKDAEVMLPDERVYPLRADLAEAIGVTPCA